MQTTYISNYYEIVTLFPGNPSCAHAPPPHTHSSISFHSLMHTTTYSLHMHITSSQWLTHTLSHAIIAQLIFCDYYCSLQIEYMYQTIYMTTLQCTLLNEIYYLSPYIYIYICMMMYIPHNCYHCIVSYLYGYPCEMLYMELFTHIWHF